MRSDIIPGGIFPDYSLPDHTNTGRRLSDGSTKAIRPVEASTATRAWFFGGTSGPGLRLVSM